MRSQWKVVCANKSWVNLIIQCVATCSGKCADDSILIYGASSIGYGRGAELAERSSEDFLDSKV